MPKETQNEDQLNVSWHTPLLADSWKLKLLSWDGFYPIDLLLAVHRICTAKSVVSMRLAGLERIWTVFYSTFSWLFHLCHSPDPPTAFHLFLSVYLVMIGCDGNRPGYVFPKLTIDKMQKIIAKYPVIRSKSLLMLIGRRSTSLICCCPFIWVRKII